MSDDQRHTILPNLDGLRAIAILPVLALHCSYGFVSGGILGVDLFFVLSGFLITWLLHKELRATGTIRFSHFFARRALRLLPAIACALVLASALWPITSRPGQNLVAATFSVLFYYSNFLKGETLGTLSSTWSLAIEEQFYLVWPFALSGLFLVFRRRLPIILTLVFAVVLVALFRGVMSTAYEGTLPLYRFTLSRVDSLLIGSLCALVADTRITARSSRIIVGAILALFCASIFVFDQDSPALYLGGFTAFGAAFGALTLALVNLPPIAPFSNPAFVWIGRRSYGLYIYHLPIVAALEELRIPGSKWNLIVVTALRIVLVFAAAAASYRFIEQPVLSLKRRFSSRATARSQNVGVASIGTP